MTTRTISIASSSALAALLIVGGYLAATPGGILVALHIANAQSSEEVLRAYAIKDTDGDGLPDWQESLYGTDPSNPSSVKAGITDGEAVTQGLIKPKVSSVVATSTPEQLVIPGETAAPGSLTDQFSQEFFQAYVQASGGQQMSTADQQALVNKLLANFTTKSSSAVASPYTIVSVHTSNNVTLLTYAASVEQVLKQNEVSVKEAPLDLADALLNNHDESARPKLKKVAAGFSGVSSGLAKLSVPPAQAQDHLMLMQTFDSLARATTLVSNYEKDPIAVLGAIATYKPTAITLVTTFNNLAKAILAGGEPAAGTPGDLLVRIARSNTPQ